MLPVTQELELVRSGAGPVEEVEEEERPAVPDKLAERGRLSGSREDGDVRDLRAGSEHRAGTLAVDANVKVVVVTHERLYDARVAGQARVRPDEDANCAGADEAVDEILGESEVDLAHVLGCDLAAVEPRVEHVCVQTVLVGDVAGKPVPRPEVAAARAG
jgi:hypothetical protein